MMLYKSLAGKEKVDLNEYKVSKQSFPRGHYNKIYVGISVGKDINNNK